MNDEKHHPLLGPGKNPQMNACLNYGVDNWVSYPLGYRKAAEVLTEFVRSEQRYQDWLVFPVLFLWRHHLELKLKAIARSCSQLLELRWTPPDQHDLSQLFGETRVLLERAFAWAGEKHPSTEVARLRTSLSDFQKVDAGSFVFRYPEDLDGTKTLQGVRYINYDNISAYFTELADLLDAADTAVAVFHDWRNEMLSAY